MKREIKFRAWHFGMERMVSCAELVTDQMPLLADGRFANVDPRHTRLTRILSYDEMLPMQFTGLKDKNGKEIYEGDIDEWGHQIQIGAFYTYLSNKGKYYTTGVFTQNAGGEELPVEDGDRAIIGNIYENPELLEAKARAI